MMGATRRDISGVFDAELGRSRKAAVLDKVFKLGPKGITFLTDTFMPEWMEVGVEMRLPRMERGVPGAGARRDQHTDIGCRGVVVQCARREQGKGFEVVLMFLDLPKRAQAQLTARPSAVAPLSISIAR
jgi:hypothetical protein